MGLQASNPARSRGRRSGRKTPYGLDPYKWDFREASGHFVVGRLDHKRQVFSRFQDTSGQIISAADSRLSHTASVVWIAQEIASQLGLNYWLSAAAAMVHDTAHCPYGHLGETILNEYLGAIGVVEKYDHVRVASYILQETINLDLCYETLQAAMWHSFSSGVMEADVPPEYRIVALADKIAYTLGDFVDAINVLGSGMYRHVTLLGDTEAARLLRDLQAVGSGLTYDDKRRTLIDAVVRESVASGEVRFWSSEEVPWFNQVRTLLGDLYAQTDLPRDIARLHRVLDLLTNSNLEGNPYLLFALLTDEELVALDCWGTARTPAHIEPEDTELLQVNTFTLPERNDFTFLTPDLGWAAP